LTCKQFPSLPLASDVSAAARHELVADYAEAGRPEAARDFFRGADAANAQSLLDALADEYTRRGDTASLARLKATR
jgi:hypothetical protein